MTGKPRRARSDLVVKAARAWIGTPYVHQASCRGAGSDCLGLLRGVWRTVVGAEPERAPSYSRSWGEGRHGEPLLAAAERWLIPDTSGGDPGPGCVMFFRMRQGGPVKHCGICTEPGFFVHAIERRGVVEIRLGASFEARMVARFFIPARR